MPLAYCSDMAGGFASSTSLIQSARPAQKIANPHVSGTSAWNFTTNWHHDHCGMLVGAEKEQDLNHGTLLHYGMLVGAEKEQDLNHGTLLHHGISHSQNCFTPISRPYHGDLFGSDNNQWMLRRDATECKK